MLIRYAVWLFVVGVGLFAGNACAPAPMSMPPTPTAFTQSTVVLLSMPTPLSTIVTPTVLDKLPRIFSSDPRALAENKAKFVAGERTLGSAVNWLLFEAERALRFEPVSVMDKKIVPPSHDKHDYMSLAPYWWPNPNTPNGLPYVRKDGMVNPEIHLVPDKDHMNNMATNVYTLALAYYFTNDEKYAAHATQLIRVWFLEDTTRMNPHMRFGQAVRGSDDGRAEGILETRVLIYVVDAVGLLAESKSWTPENQRGLTQWFADYVAWMINDPLGQVARAATNNHGVWYDVQRVSFLLFIGREDEARKILEDAKDQRIAAQIEPDGRMPRETSRADGWHYTVFNLSAFFTLATLGDRVGVDLWNYVTPDGRGIRRALDYLIHFITDEKWPHSSGTDLGWRDIYALLRQAAIKYGAMHYQQISARIPTIDPTTARINLLLPPFVMPIIQTTPTSVPTPTMTARATQPLVICDFEDDIAIWQGYDQGTETIVKTGETPPQGFWADKQLFAASLNRWYKPMPGFESSTEYVKQGTRAGKWTNVVKNNRIVTNQIPHDWSGYQYLTFWVYSVEANKSSVMLVAYSEHEPIQQNYFNYKITLDWTGWKFFVVELRQFAVTRSPVGWHKIDSLKFASSGWSQIPYSTTELYFDAMRLSNAK